MFTAGKIHIVKSWETSELWKQGCNKDKCNTETRTSEEPTKPNSGVKNKNIQPQPKILGFYETKSVFEIVFHATI